MKVLIKKSSHTTLMKIYYSKLQYTIVNFTLIHKTLLLEKYFFLQKMTPLEFLLAFRNVQSCYVYTNVYARVSIKHKKDIFKLHLHQTADQPPTNTDQGQHPLYPRYIPDASTLKSRSFRPTPVLPADQSPLCATNR